VAGISDDCISWVTVSSRQGVLDILSNAMSGYIVFRSGTLGVYALASIRKRIAVKSVSRRCYQP